MTVVPHLTLQTQDVTWQDFGRFLQHVRRRRGISQERLALLLGCHRTHIWRLEHGRNRPSNVFLHSLKGACPLMDQEAEMLAKFIELYEQRWDAFPRAAGN